MIHNLSSTCINHKKKKQNKTKTKTKKKQTNDVMKPHSKTPIPSHT